MAGLLLSDPWITQPWIRRRLILSLFPSAGQVTVWQEASTFIWS